MQGADENLEMTTRAHLPMIDGCDMTGALLSFSWLAHCEYLDLGLDRGTSGRYLGAHSQRPAVTGPD